MAHQQIISFRPQNRFLEDFDSLCTWCEDNNTSLSAVINSFLPAISYSMQNAVVRTDDGKFYVEADFGHIQFIPRVPRSYSHAIRKDKLLEGWNKPKPEWKPDRRNAKFYRDQAAKRELEAEVEKILIGVRRKS